MSRTRGSGEAGTEIAQADVSTGLEAVRSHGSRDDELRIAAEGNFFSEPFATSRMVTAEESVRFVKKVELLVRNSREYKAFVGHLRHDLAMDRCSFLPGIDMSTDDVTLEFHHHPLTLFQIVDVVLAHRLASGHAVTSLTVADEVLAAHASGMVGVLPLSRTVHRLVHAGAIVVHPAQVHGDWLSFLRAYPLGVDAETVAGLLGFCSVTEEAMVASLAKIDASASAPRLRADAVVPDPAEVRLLLTRGAV
jgi:hypothetical protein